MRIEVLAVKAPDGTIRTVLILEAGEKFFCRLEEKLGRML
jgi:hypothetical protein